MLIGILLTFQILVCVALICVILLQRSEGGALGMGGGGGGFMTARGAGNLLTRTTAILAAIFFTLSIGLTILGNFQRGSSIANKVRAIDVNQITQTSAPASAPSSAPKTPSLSDLGQPVLTATPAPETKKAGRTPSPLSPGALNVIPPMESTPSSAPASGPASK
jgi:preprotein translocase subunit SecG